MRYIEFFEDAESFAKWFGNSKVVDANGNPLRVYHGTPKDFDTFRKSSKLKNQNIARSGLNRDRHVGIFFTNNPDAAHYWAGDNSLSGYKSTPNIMPVYLSLQNPLIVDDYEKQFGSLFKSPEEIMNLEMVAKNDGNDGLIIHNIRDTPTVSHESLYIAFAPWQIKSAVGNNGNFNKFDRSITEKIVDAYHGTDADFDEFQPKNDINYDGTEFFHFGSNPNQANNRLMHTSGLAGVGSRILPMKLNLKKSLRLPDMEHWDSFSVLEAVKNLKTNKPLAAAAEQVFQMLYGKSGREKRSAAFRRAIRKYRKDHGLPYQGLFNNWPRDHGEMEFRKLANKRHNENERNAVINLLAKFGYDSIVYKNEYEGKGDSYIVFDNSKIKSRFSV